TRRVRTGHGCAHYAVVLAFGPDVGEAGLLERAAGRVVEERRRHLLARGVLRIGLDGSAAGLRDELERSVDRGARDSAAAVEPVDEDAGDPPIGPRVRGGLHLLAVSDAGQLVRAAVLGPAHRGLAVEDQR